MIKFSHAIASMGARRDARVGRRPPPSKIKKYIWAILGAFLLLFLYMGAFLATFFSFWGHFRYFLLHGGGLFWAPPPLRKFLRAPMIARRVREHMLPGNLFVLPQFSEFRTCFVTILP